MTNKGAKQNSKSLWDKSMNIAVNIIKNSSLSLAQMSLGTTAASRNHGSVSVSGLGSSAVVESAVPLVPKVLGSERSQESKSGSKPSSYLMEPDGSSYLISEEMNVNGQASDYIRRVHEKNQNDLKDTSKLSPFILPPPPRQIK